MRFIIHYIPLSRIKTDPSVRLAKPLHVIRRWMADCLHILAVRRNKKDGSYTLISGYSRYEYLQQHTNKKYAPCIIEENPTSAALRAFVLQLFRQHALTERTDEPGSGRLSPKSWSMMRAFLQREPRFGRLRPFQQFKVLLLAIRYKRTVVQSMQAKVEELLSEQAGKMP